jgi:uncharacterized protein
VFFYTQKKIISTETSKFTNNIKQALLVAYLYLHWDLVALFFTIALLYASVGFGGGSSYLAILVLTSMQFQEVRAIALICNIIVVSNSVLVHFKKQHYTFKESIPLVIVSIPMAFIGGTLSISEGIFYPLLGGCLLISALFMGILTKKHSPLPQPTNNYKPYMYGGVIGFLSGIVGIGGGIFLAPLLHLTRWNTPLKIAAITSLFIWVNSISGLLGQCLDPELQLDTDATTVLAITVVAGGYIGTHIGVNFIKARTLQLGTAVLVAYVAIRIIMKHYFDIYI